MFRNVLWTWTVVSAATLASQVAAQAQPPDTAPGSTPAPAVPTPLPGKPEATRHPTAEELLRTLQRDRPAGQIIRPASRAGKSTVADVVKRLPEGTAVVDQEGRLTPSGNAWVFSAQGQEPVTVLPNAQLENLVAAVRGSAAPPTFVVSGELTDFGGLNYLLIKTASRGPEVREDSAPPTDRPGSAQVPSDASAEAVLYTLQSLQPDEDSAAGAKGKQPGRSSTAAGGSLLDGSLVVRRPGRLLNEHGRWVFDFETPDSSKPAAVCILPNRSLELMIDQARREVAGLVFIVSGEITQFGGEDFLLVRGVTRRFDTGNLRP